MLNLINNSTENQNGKKKNELIINRSLNGFLYSYRIIIINFIKMYSRVVFIFLLVQQQYLIIFIIAVACVRVWKMSIFIYSFLIFSHLRTAYAEH